MKAAIVLMLVLTGACACSMRHVPPELELVAQSRRQWTGVAVAKDGRQFVNFPRWSDNVPISVAEILSSGSLRPYPDVHMNAWNVSAPPAEHLICVQSVYADDNGSLWIVDAANPKFQGVIQGGAKLLRVDLAQNKVAAAYNFGTDILAKDSYLNDVRVSARDKTAYMTDSGTGALIVVDLQSGAARRVLADHPSTKSEGIKINVGGSELKLPKKDVHSDGIALSPDNDWLYYHALTGRVLYRVPTAALRDKTLSSSDLAKKVENLGDTGPVDGMEFDKDGVLYLTAVEDNGVKTYSAGKPVTMLLQDRRLAWPDSFSDQAGYLYVTTSQLHFGDAPPEPYRVYRFKIE